MYTEDSPPQSHAYDELVEIVSSAVEKKNGLICQQMKEGRSFKKADLTNASCLLVHNLNAGEKPVSYRVYSTQTPHYSSILNKERRLRRDAEGGRDAHELSLP